MSFLTTIILIRITYRYTHCHFTFYRTTYIHTKLNFPIYSDLSFNSCYIIIVFYSIPSIFINITISYIISRHTCLRLFNIQ